MIARSSVLVSAVPGRRGALRTAPWLAAVFAVAAPPLLAQDSYYLHQGRRVPLERAALQLSVGAVEPGPEQRPSVVAGSETRPLGGNRWRVDLEPAPAPERKPGPTEARRRALSRQETMLERYRSRPEIAWAYPAYRAPETGALLFPTSRIIVSTAGDEQRLRASLPASLRLVRRLRVGSGIYLVELVDPKADNPVVLANRLSETQAWVQWAEPDFVQDWQSADTPNDPLYPDQWNADNDGTLGTPPGVTGADAGLEAAWDLQTGDGSVVIAIIDDGVQLDHPDLASRIFINPGEIPSNGIDDDSNGYIDDVTGWDFLEEDNDPNPYFSVTYPSHGTAVAGVAAAAGNNGIGMSGACRDCLILPVRVAVANGFITDAGLAEAISYAGTLGHILNNSWGGGSPSGAIDAAILDAVTNGRGGLGSPTLFATGNSASAYYRLTVFRTWTPGTYTFEWVFSKNGTVSVGLDAAFLDNVVFPDGTVEDFENGARAIDGRGALPSGWTSTGDADWSLLSDEARASSARGGHHALRSGAITHNQSSGVRITKTLATVDVQMTYRLWSSAEISNSDDGEGPGFNNLCSDGTQLIIYDDEMTEVYSGPVRCGTWSNQFRPLEDGTVAYPASNPNAIAVGGATNFDRRSDYSQWGPELDFVAHTNGGSVGITTTDLTGEDGYSETDYADDFGGTSSATPLAAGITGLFLTSNPLATEAQVRSALLAATRQIGPLPYARARNDSYGSGVLDASRLLGSSPTVFSDDFEDGNLDAWSNQTR